MVELAEIFRQYGPAYGEKYGAVLPPSHLAAMRAIEQCRREALGGHLYECPACHERVYSDHSCKNRRCPKCGHDAAQAWLAQQPVRLLPVPYFLGTFTRSEGLREVARRQQESVDSLRFRRSAAALQALAAEPRLVGGQMGAVGVFQSWTRDLRFQPHLHFVVPGGGLSAEGQRWLPSRDNFRVRLESLGLLFRNKFRDGLQQIKRFATVPSEVWRQHWVVDWCAVGDGVRALQYLAPSIFRLAISHHRILKLANDPVPFRYKDGDRGQWRTPSLPAEQFIHRFLQHVLAEGFVKVRDDGLLAAGNRRRRRQAQTLLGADPPRSPREKPRLRRWRPRPIPLAVPAALNPCTSSSACHLCYARGPEPLLRILAVSTVAQQASKARVSPPVLAFSAPASQALRALAAYSSCAWAAPAAPLGKTALLPPCFCPHVLLQSAHTAAGGRQRDLTPFAQIPYTLGLGFVQPGIDRGYQSMRPTSAVRFAALYPLFRSAAR